MLLAIEEKVPQPRDFFYIIKAVHKKGATLVLRLLVQCILILFS
jgi:hypothetical protein